MNTLPAVRAPLATTLFLVGLLHVAAPWASPPQVALAELPQHHGATVALVATVADVDAGDAWDRITLVEGTARALVLTPAPGPPLGARVRAIVEPGPDRSGTIAWARSIEVLATADREPLALAVLLRDAASRTNTPVATVGIWTAADEALTAGDHRLAVKPRVMPPDDGTEVLAWGQFVYDGTTGRYRLDVTGWRPWPT